MKMNTQQISCAVEDIAKNLGLKPSQILTPDARQALTVLIAEELRQLGVEAHA